MKTIVVCLAGNPNVGKTTLLNRLAGSSLKVGNWAGVTIEKKEAFTERGHYQIHFVDLPGIYTLEPLSEAEGVATDFLSQDKVDVILNIIDSSNFTRNLFLSTEVLEFETPSVIALNMIDEARKKGTRVDKEKLGDLLGVGVVETNGRTGEGVEELLEKIIEAYDGGGKPKPPIYNEEIEKVLDEIRSSHNPPVENKKQCIELLCGDPEFEGSLKGLESYFGKPFSEVIKDERWGFAHGLGKSLLTRGKSDSKAFTEKLDGFLLHPYLGIVIYVSLIYIIFKFSFDFSAPYMDWIAGFLNGYAAPLLTLFLTKIGSPDWLIRFFSEAVIGGVGFVLTFVPLVACIFFFITLLEMSGYLPRIAFLMDRFMHRIGLHGNMITPLLLGFGCNVPAIMATKNMRSKKDKFLVTMMIPFMSCPARLVVFAFFAFTFFDQPALIITLLYMIGIVVAVLTALVLRNSLFKGKAENFVLELPPYRLPSFRIVSIIVFAHVKSFLTRAGISIFIVSLVVWLLLNLPTKNTDPEGSYAAYIGKAITPVFEPIGLDDWRAPTSLIPAFLAREIALSTMAIIYISTDKRQADEGKEFSPWGGLKEQIYNLKDSFIDSLKSFAALVPGAFDVYASTGYENSLRKHIKGSFTTLSAFSFMMLLLVYNSCVATVTVMIKELGKTAAFSFLAYSFGVAWGLAFVVYQIGTYIKS